jgi:hypothetical protein
MAEDSKAAQPEEVMPSGPISQPQHSAITGDAHPSKHAEPEPEEWTKRAAKAVLTAMGFSKEEVERETYEIAVLLARHAPREK